MRKVLNPWACLLSYCSLQAALPLQLATFGNQELTHKLFLLQQGTYNLSIANLEFLKEYPLSHLSYHQSIYLGAQKLYRNSVAKFCLQMPLKYLGNSIYLIHLLNDLRKLLTLHEARV